MSVNSAERRASFARMGLIIAVALYTALLVYKPDLSPSDEYAFLPTLQSGKFFPVYGEDFPYYNSDQLGRFGPLGGQEYNLVALLTNVPAGYFMLNALELVIFVAALIMVLHAVSGNRALNYLAVALLLLLPAITNTFFKLLYVEKNVATLLAVFLAAYILFHKNNRWLAFVVTLVTANLAIYYKEPVFVAIGAFSVGRIFFTWRNADWRQRFLDIGLLTSAVIYITIYFVFVMPDRLDAASYLKGSGGTFITFLKTAFNYGAVSDPILILLVIPLTGWRLYKVFVRKADPRPLIDPMLAAATAYIGVFFVLNLYSPYYLLPAYVFGIPAICHFVSEHEFKKRAWKFFAGTAVVLFIVNSVPMGLHYLTYNKYLPINFNQTVDFLIQEVDRRYEGQRINIFFQGVDRGTGRGVYFIVGEFLRYKGLPITKFDFKTSLEALSPGPFVGKRSPFDTDETIKAVDPKGQLANPDFPFTIFQPGPLSKPQSGDLVVVSPHSTVQLTEGDRARFKRDFKLLFHTESPFFIPNLTLKTLLKYAIVNWTAIGQSRSSLIVSQNLFNWPDYYVYVKK